MKRIHKKANYAGGGCWGLGCRKSAARADGWLRPYVRCFGFNTTIPGAVIYEHLFNFEGQSLEIGGKYLFPGTVKFR